MGYEVWGFYSQSTQTPNPTPQTKRSPLTTSHLKLKTPFSLPNITAPY